MGFGVGARIAELGRVAQWEKNVGGTTNGYEWARIWGNIFLKNVGK